MLEKINGKKKLLFHCFIVSLFLVLVYTRFIGLDWGLPYPMHPDERNMANAIQSLNCGISSASWRINFQECFNPHFFAYGQFPLYLGYLITFILKLFDGDLKLPISFQEATIGLRIISAVASIINVYVLLKILKIFNFQFSIFNKFSKLIFQLFCLLILIFSPYAIQFSHFGTTESLLMMFYSATIYFSLLFIDKKINTLSFIVNSSMLVGLSIATKVSSLLFLIVPFLVLLFSKEILEHKTSISAPKNSLYFFGYKLINKIIDLTIMVFLSLVIFFIFSPHNFINFTDFISSMNYESEVALGKSLVFYTRQFFNTKPFYFQLTKIFPYVFGWPVFLMGLMGLIGTNWKDKKINLLRFAFLIYFIPCAIIYAKWSRFMSPIFPLITIFAVLFLENLITKLNHKFWIPAFAGMTIILIIPGISYLSIYQNPDIRFQASDWIYKNIPNNSYVLSETANVVDIPMINPKSKIQNPNKNFQVISFNFYDLDQSQELQLELSNHLEKADYIFVPSRRIFANHPKEKYPILNKYYEDLFSGKLGFEKVAEFSAGLNDEEAEETWTVFDHPVIRIYKKIK